MYMLMKLLCHKVACMTFSIKKKKKVPDLYNNQSVQKASNFARQSESKCLLHEAQVQTATAPLEMAYVA